MKLGVHTWRCLLCREKGFGPTREWAVRRYYRHYLVKHQAKP